MWRSRMAWKVAANIKRYEIYLANLSPTLGAEISKTRPVVIVSPDEFNDYLQTVTICPLTTKIHPRWPTRLPIFCAGKKAEVAVDQIRTIDRGRLLRRISVLTKDESVQLRRIISDTYC
jgi:mRNA interferase MazF